MAGKAGMKWQKPRRGDPRYESDVPDPAEGERVTRCFACGNPETPKRELMPGLFGFARFHVEMPLCQPCIDAAQPDKCLTCTAAVSLYPGFWRFAARPGVDMLVCEPCLRCAAARDDTADLVSLEDVA